MADGMTIQRSSFEALRNGVTLNWIFEQLDSARRRIDAPLVMMSYLNPLLAFGYDELAERAPATGVCGFIVPDLPFEESASCARRSKRAASRWCSSSRRRRRTARLRNCCARHRGLRLRGDDDRHYRRRGGPAGGPADYLDRVARYFAACRSAPVSAFARASDVDAVGRHVAGAIVGSALVEVLEQGDDPEPYLRSLIGQ